jgi:hypothetical protein
METTLTFAQLQVLSSLLRLARRREPATLEKIEVRCALSRALLERTVAELSVLDLVIAETAPRLTLPGFALAVIFTSKSPARAKHSAIRRAA